MGNFHSGESLGYLLHDLLGSFLMSVLTAEGKLKPGMSAAGNREGMLPIVYLGGGRDSEWRDEFRERFGDNLGRNKKLIEYDPFLHSRQGAIYEFTNDDLTWGVRKASLMMARVDYPRYTGLALEIGYAKALEIPTMLIWTIGGRIDSMMAGCALWIFTDTNEAFNFLEDRLI